MLSSVAASLDLHICNVGTTPTYNRVNASSVIDVTMVRFVPGRRRTVLGWAVLVELNSASDHEYIEFTVSANDGTPALRSSEVQNGWSIKKMSTTSLLKHWEGAGPADTLPAGATAEVHSAHLQSLLTKVCDAAMPRRTAFKGRRAVHWWDEEIAEMRRATIAARRRY